MILMVSIDLISGMAFKTLFNFDKHSFGLDNIHVFPSSDIAKTFMLLCLKCYVDKEDNLMWYAYLNVYALYCFASESSSIVCSLKVFASQTSILSGILILHPYPETSIFHMSPPYLPIRGIPLPLLKHRIFCVILRCSKCSISCPCFSSGGSSS